MSKQAGLVVRCCSVGMFDVPRGAAKKCVLTSIARND